MSEITKVLIANRGEIAVRVVRSLKTLGIPSVVLYHALDRDSLAVREADEAMEIIGETPVGAYLDANEVLRVARESGADAIHPGYGFLSENAEFADAVSSAGIVFIGPQPDSIRLMGDKMASREFVEKQGFPISPSVPFTGDIKSFVREATQIGFPLLIKASAGGGGKGMQIVESASELEAKATTAANEAERYFGNGAIYAERYIINPRHIEVQVLGDGKGNAVHLFERECSVQRRFQKIIEESPSPALSDELRQKICNVAVGITKASKYLNAGTVEFILAPDAEFYFLEMNTRLQVEHPVTEMITGVDLVVEQITLAEGKGLSLSQDQITATGHSIECRVYAEDADEGFLPAIGNILSLKEPTGPGVRVDSGIVEGGSVTASFDPMLSKVITHGKDRNQAIGRAIMALNNTAILGVTTNTAYMARVLDHQAFRSGSYHTGTLEEAQAELVPSDLELSDEEVVLVAAALFVQAGAGSIPEAPLPYSAIGAWRN
ncbi:MAG: ATP-grasp domain-containing protein [Alphaproteobacteria bacterium]|nr:ATP-grasp domain-containing protein [Alphaproteobacteria bacterium]